jgi:LemA protein
VIGLWIVIAVVVLLLALFIASYNRFVRQRNLVQEAWRQVDVELRRRHDLIPNLIETVKGYAAQERTVLTAVTEARTAAVSTMQATSTGVAAQAQAESTLGRALGGLFAVAENYPDLKSSQNFLALQQQLAETEDRIAAGRRFYNGNVRALNTRVEAFPSSLVASMFHVEKADYFEVDEPEVRAPVAVDFSAIGGQPPASPPPAAAPPGTQPPGSSGSAQSPQTGQSPT